MVIASFAALNENYKNLYNDQRSSSVVPYTWSHIWKSLISKQVTYSLFLNVGLFGSLIMYTYEIYLDPLKPLTIAWIFIFGIGTSLGTTAGAHRLWSHRSYKANLPLRILLMILYSAMGMNSLHDWVRDHRVHHRYLETDADPYNAKRGLIFSHIGWLCMERHPECLRRGREIDMSDIKADRVVMFYEKYRLLMNGFLCFFLPTLVPILLWEETLLNAVLSQCVIRYALFLHIALSINSFAHLFDNYPYHRFISPTENPLISFLTCGDRWFNYHQTFPWDYKTSELPYLNFNGGKWFIQAMKKIGWAYDLREPSLELVEIIDHEFESKNRGLFSRRTIRAFLSEDEGFH